MIVVKYQCYIIGRFHPTAKAVGFLAPVHKEYLQGIVRVLNLSSDWVLNDKPDGNNIFENSINVFVIPDERFIKNKKKINEIAQTVTGLFYEFLRENKILKIHIAQSKSSMIFIFCTSTSELLMIKVTFPELINAFYSVIGRLRVGMINMSIYEFSVPEDVFSNLGDKVVSKNIAAIMEIFKIETFEFTQEDIIAITKTFENRLLIKNEAYNESHLNRVKRIYKEIKEHNINIEDIQKFMLKGEN